MGYPYGTQGVPPALLAPGLPRKGAAVTVGADPTGFPAKFMLVRTNQTLRVPDWATYARLGATGAGGAGASSTNSAADRGNAGGGGGFAGSNQIPVKPGMPITVSFTGTATVVEGLGYRLVGGNGGDANVAYLGYGAAGVGSGGDVNYPGGTGGQGLNAGSSGGGGGAASRGGAGQGGGSPTSGGTTGGSGGSGADHIGGGSGGGFGTVNGGSAGTPGGVGPSPSATTLGSGVITVGVASNGMTGGDCGGGGGGQINTSGLTTNFGGAGFALIEFW